MQSSKATARPRFSFAQNIEQVEPTIAEIELTED
jgi:hypothetical protein